MKKGELFRIGNAVAEIFDADNDGFPRAVVIRFYSTPKMQPIVQYKRTLVRGDKQHIVMQEWNLN